MKNTENTPKAILLVIIGMTVFAVQDALIKYISYESNIFLIYFFRAILGIIILCLYLYYNNKPIIFKTYYPKLTILRCVLFFCSFVYFLKILKQNLQNKKLSSQQKRIFSMVLIFTVKIKILSLLQY